MDRLAKLIDNYNCGIIPLERLQSELEFAQWQEETEQGRKRDAIVLMIKNNMYNSLSVLTTKTPEEIVLEEEKQSEILEMLSSIREVIGDRDYKILTLYVVDKLTQQRIAKSFNLTQQQVNKILLYSIKRRINQKRCNYPQYFTILCRENLLPKQSQLEARSPETKGYPFEFLQKVSVSGSWQIRQKKYAITLQNGNTVKGKIGKRTYVSNSICLLPEYFKESFRDKKTVCPICDKCKRQI